MSAVAITVGGLAERVGLDPALAADLRASVDEHASDVDAGRVDLRPALSTLAERSVLGWGAPANADGRLPSLAAVVGVLAGGCLSTAFATWAHRAVIEYLATSDNRHLREEVLPTLTAGERIGATAMATAFQADLGLRDLEVRARRDGAGIVLDGRVTWASNLYPHGSLIVLPAVADDGTRLVVAVPTPTEGLRLAPYPSLLALQATASTSVVLDGVRIDDHWVVSERFPQFLAAVRPTFLLVQAAFCVGLAEEALARTRDRLAGPSEEFAGDVADLSDKHADVVERLVVHADQVGGPRPPAPVDVTRVRLDAARLALDAVQLEAKVAGGAGYLASSATARRVREAAFLPIQSPTEAQLRWELSRSA